jgi:hypothetical protein
MHVYEVRPRKDNRGVNLISDALRFGRLWYAASDHAIGYAMHFSRSHDAVIRVYDDAGNVIETHEHEGISGSGEVALSIDPLTDADGKRGRPGLGRVVEELPAMRTTEAVDEYDLPRTRESGTGTALLALGSRRRRRSGRRRG